MIKRWIPLGDLMNAVDNTDVDMTPTEVVSAYDYEIQINRARDILSRAVMHFYERDDYNDEVHGRLRREIDQFLGDTGGLPEAFARLVPK